MHRSGLPKIDIEIIGYNEILGRDYGIEKLQGALMIPTKPVGR